jgi:hypothetical protein
MFALVPRSSPFAVLPLSLILRKKRQIHYFFIIYFFAGQTKVCGAKKVKNFPCGANKSIKFCPAGQKKIFEIDSHKKLNKYVTFFRAECLFFFFFEGRCLFSRFFYGLWPPFLWFMANFQLKVKGFSARRN